MPLGILAILGIGALIYACTAGGASAAAPIAAAPLISAPASAPMATSTAFISPNTVMTSSNAIAPPQYQPNARSPLPGSAVSGPASSPFPGFRP